ncbi:unnamed protein product [Heterobilharzia americana]|nr:unnamed protein product [Heterobilharzia americana]CAH8630621.1 unnamed protein product [Heterobilharzia americana]
MCLWWRLLAVVLLSNGVNYCFSVVLLANDSNFNSLISGYDLTLLKFSAEWCHFSQMLAPIFEQTSEKITELTKNGKAALITIDCEASQNLCSKENIRKYPTVKVSKYGKILKREYRDQRTVEAFVKFIEDNLKSPVDIVNGQGMTPDRVINLKVWTNKSSEKNTILALVNDINAPNSHVNTFKMVASIERDSCAFQIVYNLTMNDERLALYDPVVNKITAATILKNADLTAVHNWVKKQCTNLVRELTFANAEEITEERLPLMLLFYHPKNKTIVSRFVEFARNHLTEHQSTINIVTADGMTFSHPLAHLGKSEVDLPFICLDSFAHMYVFPGTVETAISDPKYLNQFVEDLKSGKLHLEYHYGSNVLTSTTTSDNEESVKTTPHASVFQRLTPSRMRYTIIHDEF